MDAYRAAIVSRNLADTALITASSSYVLMTTAELQTPHVARKWRGRAGESETLLIDLLGQAEIDTAALIGVNVSANAMVRVRFATADASGLVGNAYDSGVSPAGVDPAYGYLVHLMPAPATGRYLRIDITNPGAAYIEAGRLVVALRNQFRFNFAFGWSRAWVDRSRKSESRGGQIFVDRDNTYRVVSVSFETLTKSERNGFIEALDRENGERDDVLFITDPTSDNLGRDSIWGLVDGLSDVVQPVGWIDGEPIFSKPLKIRERL